MKKLIFSKDYPKVEKLGLIDSERWDKGIDHHPMSIRLVKFMADNDYNDYNDTMRIKTGGDGDNGEHMMFLMDPFFEMLDLTEDNKNYDTLEIGYYWVEWEEKGNWLIFWFNGENFRPCLGKIELSDDRILRVDKRRLQHAIY